MAAEEAGKSGSKKSWLVVGPGRSGMKPELPEQGLWVSQTAKGLWGLNTERLHPPAGPVTLQESH